MNEVVTRFAPSPTGNLHIGSVRTALINYIYVQQKKLKYPESKFLIRIEDTDKIRSKNEYKDNILKGLKWLGLNWDDDVFIQSQRIERHKKIANELFNKGHAFKCICTPSELEKRRIENQRKQKNIKRLCLNCQNNANIQQLENNYCLRIKIPNDGRLSIMDKIQGTVIVENKEIDNFILLRQDGSPTYMLSVVIDDHDMKVSNIIRGDDHLNNTFRQIHIYKHMKWPIPYYAHLPLIHGMDGSKLSKRHGAVDINEFKKIGYLPQSIINNLILLGWSPKKNDEIIEMAEIIKIYKLKEISKSSSIFDYNKLNYFNNQYLRKEENYKFFEKFNKENIVLKSYFQDDSNKIKNIFETFKKNINYYSELENIAKIYSDKSFRTQNNMILNEDFNLNLKEFIMELNKISEWNHQHINNCIESFVKKNKIKFAIFGKPLRYVLTNSKNGPSIKDILYILGKESALLRLNNYINRIS